MRDYRMANSPVGSQEKGYIRMRPIARGILVVVATTMILAGCGSTATSAPLLASAAPPGNTASTTPSASPAASPGPSLTAAPSPSSPAAMHVTLPAGWQQVEMTEAALTGMIQTLTPSNPGLAQAMDLMLTSGQYKNIELLAIDYEALNPVGSVLAFPVPLGGVSLDAMVPVLEGQFKSVGATGFKTSHATLLGADALVIDYKLDVKAGTSTKPSTNRVYIIPVDDLAYDVTVSCLGSNVTSCLADGETMVQGMTIGP